MSNNPYAPPESSGSRMSGASSRDDELAGRFTRLVASIIDGILIMVIVMPIFFFSGYIDRLMTEDVGFVEQLMMSFVGMAAFLLIHGYTLINRGQSLGKMATGIQIVDVENGRLLSVLRVYVYRYLWTTPLVILTTLIPGTGDEFLLNIVMFIDAVMIFGSERRCLHDHIAGSKVVLFKEGRKKGS